MKRLDVLVIGGGPAGISAAIAAGKMGLEVVLLEEREFLGGQLVKQTHRFFGSKEEHAGVRGIDIVTELTATLSGMPNVSTWLEATALGLYEDGVVTVLHQGRMHKFLPRSIVAATGAFERFLPFENNDLPGVFGAGAVQTLMNMYGVKPAQKVLMVGSGNIGLIVSYQLIQAGVEVVAVLEAAGNIGGYLVHASKLRRLGVPILTHYTVQKAIGTSEVEGAIAVRLDDRWNPVEGSEILFPCDAICLATGLSPLGEILSQAGCQVKYVPELGGDVPVRDENLQTTRPGVFVAGDLAGIEEATAAMLEGELAGLGAARTVLSQRASPWSEEDLEKRVQDLKQKLSGLRAGPVGEKIRKGLGRLRPAGESGEDVPEKKPSPQDQPPLEELWKTGIPTPSQLQRKLPEEARKQPRPFAVVECFQQIPCDPCVQSCPVGAIAPFSTINDIPQVDFARCTGCGNCIARCPGLAIFVVGYQPEKGKATVSLPYELLPRPKKGQVVEVLDRAGRVAGEGTVLSVLDSPRMDRTAVVKVEVDPELAMEVRMVRCPVENVNAQETQQEHLAQPNEEEWAQDPTLPGDDTIVCRCEDVTLGQIRELIQKGFTTIEEIKHVSRCGMGPCQGKTCSPIIAREIARITGKPLDQVKPAKTRPPFGGILFEEVVRSEEESDGGEAYEA
ncbi:MAG TPA: FAD-dependent oxidoreductase [Thermotogota bacterium]|nr:FAD-dependent oxidoreductase [Thermotogota bacterium]